MRSVAFEVSFATCLLATSLVVACGDASPPSPSSGVADSGPSSSAGPVNVTVDYKGASVTVDLTTVPKQDYKGSEVVSLGKVWEASGTAGDLAKLEFDFEGDDGFRPSSKDRCKTKVGGTQISQGYVLPETRTLIWDDTIGLPGCYSVKGVAKILATDK